MRIRATLFVTLYGNQKTITLPPGSKSVAVPEVGLCGSANPDFYRCRAPFRGPRVRLATPGVALSYTPTSPFPAEIGISPMWTFANLAYGLRGPLEVPASPPLIIEEPKAHLRRILTLDNIRMTDY